MSFLRRFFSVGPNSADPDERVIAAISAHGADLSKPREIRHFLYFDTEVGTRAAVQLLDRGDRFVHARIDPETGRSQVTITHTAVVSLESMRTLRAELEMVARTHGGQYDGWEAAARP